MNKELSKRDLLDSIKEMQKHQAEQVKVLESGKTLKSSDDELRLISHIISYSQVIVRKSLQLKAKVEAEVRGPCQEVILTEEETEEMGVMKRAWGEFAL